MDAEDMQYTEKPPYIKRQYDHSTMIIRYTAEIEGAVVKSEQTQFSINEFTAKLHFSESGGLESVSIERVLTKEEKEQFTNTIEKQDNSTYRIEVSGYQTFHDEAINTL
jgi:hypothetical protein